MNQEALRHADKCRFCWMCRHLCPVQLYTGKEINTPRAKGLLLSMVRRGTEFDADLAEAMYECLLCDACTNDCATGYNPPLFIRDARTEAAVLGLTPEKVQKVIDTVLETGNIYGVEKPSFGEEGGKEALVYVGEVAAVKAPEMVRAYLTLLKKAGVKYTVLSEEPASGVMLADLLGYTAEAEEAARLCAEAINGVGAEKVVVLDSYDAQLMAEKYPEWGFEIRGGVTTATAFLAALLKEGKLQIETSASGKAAYHDDDRLARFFREYEPAREILQAIGYENVEMFNHLALSKSAGSSVAKAYMPEIVKGVSEGRWSDLLRTDAEILLVSNPESYECLAETVPSGKKLADLYSALLSVVK